MVFIVEIYSVFDIIQRHASVYCARINIYKAYVGGKLFCNGALSCSGRPVDCDTSIFHVILTSRFG